MWVFSLFYISFYAFILIIVRSGQYNLREKTLNKKEEHLIFTSSFYLCILMTMSIFASFFNKIKSSSSKSKASEQIHSDGFTMNSLLQLCSCNNASV